MIKSISGFLLSAFLLMNISCCCSFASGTDDYGTILQTEHLVQPENVAKKSPTNVVVTTKTINSVVEYNLIEVSFAENFSTKNAKVGDEIGFMLESGLKTKEGTVILPEGSQITAKVTEIEKPKSFNRSGKVSLSFEKVVLPDGRCIPLNAQVYTKNGKLSRGKLNALGKGLGTTLGSSAVGIGAGCGIGVAAGAVCIGGFAIGLPVGFAVGALAGLCTPGLHYKAKPGDKIVVQLTDNLNLLK